tara:strand:- start:13 stop:1062 length:1050 start_codon:yes stop_codon:yes gene_type:complete
MNTLLNKNKPLLIHGSPGSGKSYKSDILSEGMVVTKIDSSMLKGIKNDDYLTSIVKKRNITLMFNEVKENRCLIIDDIHIFQKHDRSFFKSMIEFIKKGKYYHTYIILICNNSFLKNKELIKIKKFITYYEIKYTYSEYYKLCLKISEKNNYHYTLDELDKKIYFSGYNFNNFKSSCDEQVLNSKDNYDSIDILTKSLLMDKYKYDELFRICEGDEILLSYNLLENIERIVKCDLKRYYYIYQSFVYSDIIEYNIVKNDKELNIKYMSILSIFIINYYINNKCNNIVSNRYISKCMVLANKKYILNLDYLIYLFDVFKKHNEYEDILMLNDKKEVDNIKKIYDIFYLGI